MNACALSYFTHGMFDLIYGEVKANRFVNFIITLRCFFVRYYVLFKTHEI